MQQAQRLIGIARQLLEPEIRYLPPEIIAGHVFHFMRFVENHRRIFRQDAAEIVLLQRQVRKEQMVIHDNQVGFLRALVHAGHKAWVERRAVLARAGVPSRVQLSPKLGIIRQEGELRAVAGLRQFRPILDLAEGVQLFHSLQQSLVSHLI